MVTGMKMRICAADDCSEPFDPVLPEQKYHSKRCASRMRQRLYRARHKLKPRGGGPGGARLLFPKSALPRRKPAKAVVKPKQDGLFPENGDGLYATQAGGLGYDTLPDGQVRITSYRTRKPSRSVAIPEADRAA